MAVEGNFDNRVNPEVFNTTQLTLGMLTNDIIVFDQHCKDSAYPLQQQKKYGALYFIASSHFYICI